ncbi:glycoside hydrolase family 15 protein [Synechococcus sp. CS-602]|uniref:glycoside hydrolase family 15 protein n=2 Tax=Synechococcales TaxID=1890424 RepID=UPI0037DA6DFE|nr:glycoside hydrolase family 15 protein [Synechococcus sp. CS-603]MCT0204062.1 glycoside hydrolase family 15 protein [Synechococcus sp. CS-602]
MTDPGRGNDQGPRVLADAEAQAMLQLLDGQIERAVLVRQHPISGLLPASTANTVHGNYGDAWVRDCVYSIQCVWGLALAHRRLNGASQRVFELEQRVLMLMRGLLVAMLRQADKVERFKNSLDRGDAIHAKFDTCRGEPVVADDGWGHLQLDATALYLLQLAQLTKSGLVVVQSHHERDFLQNLVYYVARAYRVADYGIWERGDKGNHGEPERNASSIGLVKAALEALDGLDLYGPHGDGSCCLHIPQPPVMRLRRALQALLPRESASKEVDSACLSVIGYPAWAVEDPLLVERTRDKIRRELGGFYGYKRFRRDGHQTVVEDHHRLHYEREELAQFEAIECEWPLFFAYELVTACCESRWEEAWSWRRRLEAVSLEVDGLPLLPELYLVPQESIEAERLQPGSQARIANANVPLLWTQSLTWLGDLLLNGLIKPEDIDPIGRRHPIQPGAEQLLVALAPANASIAAALEAAGLPVSGAESVTEEDWAGGARPVRLAGSRDLAARMAEVGANAKLGLSGHPPVRMETMATARVYHDSAGLIAFLPAVLEEGTFYLVDDPEQLGDTVIGELRLLQRHWRGSGQPLLVIPVAAGPFQRDPEAILRLGHALASGCIEGVPVRLDRLEALSAWACWVDLPAQAIGSSAASIAATPMLPSSSHHPLTIEQEQELEEIPIADLAERLWGSTSLSEQAELLEQLVRRLGQNAILQGPSQGGPVRLQALVEEIYRRSLGESDWSVVRRCAGLIDLVHPQLEDAMTDLLVRQKQLVVGRNYTHDSLITQPQGSATIAAMIRRFSGEDGREWMLQQELLLALDGLARLEPALLSGSLTLQLGQLLLLLTGELAAEQDLSPGDAFEALCSLPPHAIRRRLRAVLADVDHARDALRRKEQLHLSGRVRWDVPVALETLPSGETRWLQHRQRLGALQRVPRDFYAGVWDLLHHCRGLVIGDKLERRNRLESAPLISEKTPGERNFAALVEHLLSKIEAPEYRRLCCETLLSLVAFVGANPEVRFDDNLALDVVIGHAVRVGWQQDHGDSSAEAYGLHKAEAWDSFYRASPASCRRWQILALRDLTKGIESGPVQIGASSVMQSEG